WARKAPGTQRDASASASRYAGPLDDVIRNTSGFRCWEGTAGRTRRGKEGTAHLSPGALLEIALHFGQRYGQQLDASGFAEPLEEIGLDLRRPARVYLTGSIDELAHALPSEFITKLDDLGGDHHLLDEMGG